MASSENEEKNNMFKEAIRCFNGNLDFGKLAEKLEVVNADAMRKRFRRAFEKDAEGPLEIRGNHIGGGPVVLVPPKSAKSPRKPVTGEENDDEAPKTRKVPKTPKSTGKKRKAEEEADGGSDQNDDSTVAETPKTPTTTKKPKTAKSPKAPKTPKRANNKTSAKATMEDDGDKVEKLSEAANGDINGDETAGI